MTIPFNKPSLAGREVSYILDAVRRGHLSGDGTYCRQCERLLEESLGAARVFLTPSCTAALEMASLLVDVEPGDEVIVPSFTFVSTANAFALRGARLVFADVSADTFNIDPASVERLLSPRTRAIVPVHYAGVGCDMDALGRIAANHGVTLVEDNAHGLFGRRGGRFLGTFGRMATLSFHETKNFTCGEGGALIVNDPDLIPRAEIVREKGTNRSRYFRGEVDKYTWVDVGSSYLPSEVQAAFLLAQLEERAAILSRRAHLHELYRTGLTEWAESIGARLPIVPPDCEQAWHMFYVLMPTLEARQALIAHLKARGIMAVFHYVPLHLSPMGQRAGSRPGDCPVSEQAGDRLLRLPFFNELRDTDVETVCAAVREFHPAA